MIGTAKARAQDSQLWHGYQLPDSTMHARNIKIVFPDRPNEIRDWVWRARFWVVFVFVDDLGWGDAPCYGSRISKTANLDKVEVNQARGMPNFLDPGVPMLTKPLKTAGYAAGHFGKWHMGGAQDKSTHLPSEYGIDVSGATHSIGTKVFRKGVDTGAHSSARVMDQTLNFIEVSASGPFEYPWPGTEPSALPWKGFEWRMSY
jgi:arylsulfatase A-like enzyme